MVRDRPDKSRSTSRPAAGTGPRARSSGDAGRDLPGPSLLTASADLRRLLAWLPVFLAGLIVLGLLLLQIPGAVKPWYEVRRLEQLYLVASCVCNVGLYTGAPHNQYGPLGQVVLLLLMQAGALTVMVVGSAAVCRLSLWRDRPGSTESGRAPLRLEVPSLGRLVRAAVLATLLAQAALALLLLPLWRNDDQTRTLMDRLGLSLFHAISAWTNTGLSLAGDLPAQRHGGPGLLLHLGLAPAIVLGGLGLPVLLDLAAWVRCLCRRLTARRPVADDAGAATVAPGLVPTRQALSPLTGVVLTSTAAVYLLGVATLLAGQWAPYTYAYFQQGLAYGDREVAPLAQVWKADLADASFLALNARSGGFAVMELESLAGAGLAAVWVLMVLGAGVAGAAGGLGALALAAVARSVRNGWTGRGALRLGGAVLGPALLRAAMNMLAFLVGLIALVTFLLCLSEPYPPVRLFFEAASAVSGSGLTLGQGMDLTAMGQATLIGGMFLGRVGLLTLLGHAVCEELDSPPAAPLPA